VLDTDAACYGGSNYRDGAAANAEPGLWQDLPASLALNLPPLATLILRLDGSYNAAWAAEHRREAAGGTPRHFAPLCLPPSGSAAPSWHR
jgi:hypothetical protein